MLPESDRRSAHALAGRWLEQAGVPSALTLANHFELGGVADRAVHWLTAAAQTAMQGGNITEVLQCVERGLRLAVSADERGHLLWIKGEGHAMRSEWPEALRDYQLAVRLLPPGGVGWVAATAGSLLAASFLGDQASTLEAMHSLLTTTLQAEVSGAYGMAMFIASQGLAYTSRIEQAEALLARVEALAAQSGGADLMFEMWLGLGRGFIELSRGNLGTAHARLASTVSLAEQLGSVLGRGLGGLYLVAVLAHSGHLDRARAQAEAATNLCAPIGFQLIDEYASYFATAAAVFSGQNMDQAITAELRAMCRSRDPRLANSARIYLAHMLVKSDELVEADAESQRALHESVFSTERAAALAVRAEVELALGHFEAALAAADQGVESAKSGAFPWTATTLHLAKARALIGLGNVTEALDVARGARARVLGIAASLEDAALRESFLTSMSANLETLLLVEQLEHSGSYVQ
jgi:tetratricopeptide (TPR) repeat protein